MDINNKILHLNCSVLISEIEDVHDYLSHPRKYLTYSNPSIDPNLRTELLKKQFIYLWFSIVH